MLCPNDTPSFNLKQQLWPRRTEYHAKALVAKKRVTISSFPCVECKFVTKDYYDLKRHVKNAHPKYKFKCRDKKCPEVFFDRENRRRHWVRKFGKFLKSFVWANRFPDQFDVQRDPELIKTGSFWTLPNLPFFQRWTNTNSWVKCFAKSAPGTTRIWKRSTSTWRATTRPTNQRATFVAKLLLRFRNSKNTEGINPFILTKNPVFSLIPIIIISKIWKFGRFRFSHQGLVVLS